MFTVDKDPEAVLDYGFDWAEFIGADTISVSTWNAETGITIDSNNKAGAVTTVWLSGGVVESSYKVTNHITTAGGREDDRTILVLVDDK